MAKSSWEWAHFLLLPILLKIIHLLHKEGNDIKHVGPKSRSKKGVPCWREGRVKMLLKDCDVIYEWYLCETPRGFWIFYEMTNVSIDLREYESHVVAQANLTPSNCFQRSRTTLIEICKIATPENRILLRMEFQVGHLMLP